MKRLFLCFFLISILFLALSGFALGTASRASAAFHGSLDITGSSLSMTLSFDGGQEPAGAFLLRMDHSASWTLTRTEDHQPGYVVHNSREGTVESAFVLQEGQHLAVGKVFTYHFRLADAAEGPSQVHVTLDWLAAGGSFSSNACQFQLEYLPPPLPSSQAELLSLVPSSGQLSPAFSPDITHYALTVPFAVTSLSYSAEVSQGASFSINRKNLGAGGSYTLFHIQVTAEDGVTQQLYTVNVYREPKPTPSPLPSPTPKPTNTPKPSATPKPTRTPKPSATPKPTNTPKPSATPKPTNTPKPSATPKPTNTPKPSATPKPTRTPKPSATPKPTNTPKPSATPKPTRTPKPSATPKPSKTPKPSSSPKPQMGSLSPSPGPGGGTAPAAVSQLVLRGDQSSWQTCFWVISILMLFQNADKIIGKLANLRGSKDKDDRKPPDGG